MLDYEFQRSARVLGAGRSVAASRDVDTAKYRKLARGEAMECGAIIDLIRLIDAVPELELTAAMLSNMGR
ncbi:MAG: hypothetical protein AB7T06_30435 [Kofleriaceae bacterium]